MTLIITFDLENDLGSSILFQKWILDARIIWKSGITLLSRHISSKVAFCSVFDMLISYYAHKKSSPRLPSWQPSLISFNIPIESGSIIKPCTLKHFQVPILAPGLIIDCNNTASEKSRKCNPGGRMAHFVRKPWKWHPKHFLSLIV